jgi:hypothetical protein
LLLLMLLCSRLLLPQSFSQAYPNDLSAMGSMSSLPPPPFGAAVGGSPVAAAAASVSRVSRAAVLEPTLIDDLPPVDSTTDSSSSGGPTKLDVAPLACAGSALVNDGNSCAFGCMSLFGSDLLTGASSCLGKCLSNPCINTNIAQLQTAQIKALLDKNAQKSKPQSLGAGEELVDPNSSSSSAETRLPSAPRGP